MVITAHIDGFLVVGEQVIQPFEVSLPLPQRQLQLVYLIVFLLNGSKLLIQCLL